MAYDLPFWGGGGESLSARLLKKSLHSFPIRPFVPKNQGGKRTHFHVNNSLLVIPCLVFLMLHEDRFCGFVLVTRWVHMRSTYIEECCFSSWPETSCLYVQYSLRAWILAWIPHCRSVGGGAIHRHPCRLCWAEMWEGSGCHHVFVQQNPPSYTTGRGWVWIDLHTCNGSARL